MLWIVSLLFNNVCVCGWVRCTIKVNAVQLKLCVCVGVLWKAFEQLLNPCWERTTFKGKILLWRPFEVKCKRVEMGVGYTFSCLIQSKMTILIWNGLFFQYKYFFSAFICCYHSAWNEMQDVGNLPTSSFSTPHRLCKKATDCVLSHFHLCVCVCFYRFAS